MDKFLIDSHKYSFHPNHVSNVVNYLSDREDASYISSYKHQHPLYIEVSPVGACNHRCTFCAVDYIGYKSIFMDFEHYSRTIDSMAGKGTKSIMFAGEGEPLLHPRIADFVSYTKSSGIDVSFTTNAFRLDKSFVDSSLENISWIKVSFNGGNPDTYSKIHTTSANDFAVVSKNIEYAVNQRDSKKLDCKIGLQCLLLPDNSDSIHDLCKHAKNIGADYLVIKPYSQHKFSETTTYSDIDYSDYLYLEEELASYNDKSFDVVFRINTIKNWISQNDDRYCKCLATPSTWGYIMADGSVYSCSAFLLDDRFKLGSITDQTFDEIWASELRMKHSRYILDEHDISECRVNCRMDQVNRYLDSVVNQTVPHINFV